MNPKLTIVFEDLRGDEKERIVYHEPDGILGFIRELNFNKEAVHEPVYFKGEEGVKLASFSFKIPSSLAYWLMIVVNVVLKPVR